MNMSPSAMTILTGTPTKAITLVPRKKHVLQGTSAAQYPNWEFWTNDTHNSGGSDSLFDWPVPKGSGAEPSAAASVGIEEVASTLPPLRENTRSSGGAFTSS